ncbi:MAG: leucine-rich repeat domain-containing protein [Cyanobacteria bacterium P01_D01_bin.115]
MTQDELLALIDQAAIEGWTELDLSGQGLTELPPEIGQLTQLETLILGKQVEGYERVGDRFLPKVVSNALTALPEALGHLDQLQVLDLSGNPFTTLPEVVTQLPQLQKLVGVRLKLEQIPDSLSQSPQLQQLDLFNNQITTIPDSLAQSPQLQQLDLSVNQITTIPDSLAQSPQLQKLDLRRNPLPISPEILGPPEFHRAPGSVAAIFNYVRLLRSGEVKPLNEAKLLLVGQGSVGKTSLVNRLIDDRFDQNESQTAGLHRRNWSVNVNSKDVRLPLLR